MTAGRQSKLNAALRRADKINSATADLEGYFQEGDGEEVYSGLIELLEELGMEDEAYEAAQIAEYAAELNQRACQLCEELEREGARRRARAA